MDGFGPITAFYGLSALALVAALMVMFSRSIIHAVLFLVGFFVATAALFVLLTADFLAVAQLLVYAGAIGVLVIFAILLTPPREERTMETRFLGPGLLVGVVTAGTLIYVALHTNWATAGTGGFSTTVDAIGQALLNRWALPFEIASVLLLAAMVGAIVIVRGRAEDQLGDVGSTSPFAFTRRER